MVMKKAYALLSRNRKKVWFSAALNALFLLLLLVVTRPYFETNDDITLAGFFNLSRGTQDAWTNISNGLFGVIVGACYRLTAQIPWYILFLYGAAFFSLTTVTYVLLNRFEGWPGMMLSGVLLAYFGYECYTAVNFTKIAACAGAAGIFLIYDSVRDGRPRIPGIVIGSLVILMGYLIRPEEALAAVVSTAAGAFFLILRIRREVPEGRRLRRLGMYILAVVPAVLLVAATKKYDTFLLKSSAERTAYQEYTTARSSLLDYDFPPYSGHETEYEQLGINQNAWVLYKGWNFYDPDKMSVQVMQQIAKFQQERKIDRKLVKDFLGLYPDRFFRNQMFLIYLFVLTLVILYGSHSAEGAASVLLQIFLIGGLFFYLFYAGRYGVRRVDIGIWWGGTLGLQVVLDQRNLHFSPKAAAAVMMFALIMNQMTWAPHYCRQTVHARMEARNKQNYVSQMSNDTDHLYICLSNCYYPAGAYGPFDRVPVGATANIITLGGWATKSIPYMSVFERYGIHNPYRDMIDNEKVRLVADSPERVLTYLHDYYDPDCTAEKVGTIGHHNLYVFHS